MNALHRPPLLAQAWHVSFLLLALTSLGLAVWGGLQLVRPTPYSGIELAGLEAHVHFIDPDGPAAHTELRAGDRLLAVDGIPVYRAPALYRGKRIGEPISIRAHRSGEAFEVTLRLTDLSEREWRFRLERLLAGLVFWIVGTLVWMLRPAHGTTRIFFLTSQTIACLLWSDILDPGLTWAILYSDLFMVLLGPIALHLYTTFPDRLPDPLRRWLLRLGYGGAALLILWSYAVGLWPSAEPSKVWTVQRAFQILTVLGAQVLLFRPQPGASLQVRRRRRLLIAGMVVGISPIVVLTLAAGLVLGAPVLDYDWTLPALALVPITYAYAVYKGELGQLDLILNRSLVYLVLTALLLSGYAVLFLSFDHFLDPGRSRSGLFSSAVLVILGTALFVPLRVRLQKRVDRLFYGGWYDYRTLVLAVSAELTRTTDLGHLLAQMRTVAEKMRVQAAAVLRPDARSFRMVDSFGFEEGWLGRMDLPPNGALLGQLRRAARPCTREMLLRTLAGARLTPEEHRALVSDQIQLWIPVISRGELRAVMVMGPRPADDLLGKEDLDILTTFAGQAAIAFENVELLESLRARLAREERMRRELSETRLRLAEGREAERLHLARELHDGPVQELYAIGHALDALSASVRGTADRRAAEIRSSVERVATRVREICVQLRPPMLSEFGLEVAIRSLAEGFQIRQPGLEVVLDLMPDRSQLPERVQLALFRICQEAMNNALQHGRAREIRVAFELDAECVSLTVSDDGCGFTLPEAWIDLGRQGHLGLIGIAERAEAIGGRLEVVSAPGAGTLLRVVAPCPDVQETETHEAVL